MEEARPGDPAMPSAVRVVNPDGASPFIILCDHASNRIPAPYGTLGLQPGDLQRHIAWDPGALPVAEQIAEALDAPLVASGISRLIIDCNRPLDAPDLIAGTSETTVVPGNAGLSPQERAARIALSWTPFHEAIDGLVSGRLADGLPVRLVSIHSFNPVYRGVARPWHIGILHDGELGTAGPLLSALRREAGLVVGDNQPYSPADRVYFTLEKHGRARGLSCAMIEIRNDEIADAAAQSTWAERLAAILAELVREGYGLDNAGHREHLAARGTSR